MPVICEGRASAIVIAGVWAIVSAGVSEIVSAGVWAIVIAGVSAIVVAGASAIVVAGGLRGWQMSGEGAEKTGRPGRSCVDGASRWGSAHKKPVLWRQ
ncbi:hypothetical protein [Anaeromyxobacter oryzae]|uniref:Uncharacterized protein n=1 Tax=Anaeromyxobacter oryzae TaxID=2918170 RepID=A0ABN6MW96_9BACT|nr:hypothetical protein [Anaeromyxobacter oryzae]BDG05183.1 hypothetical protein AMOR_41790 [Anaeromyxobacter oryzae]